MRFAFWLDTRPSWGRNGRLAIGLGSILLAAAPAARAQSGFGYGGDVHVLVLQPNGKNLVAGTFSSYNDNEAASDDIVRLNRDGTLDKTFNYRAGDNRSGASGFDGSGLITALALQPDGKILVGGYWLRYNAGLGPKAPYNLMRLNADGSVDTSFNLDNGKTITSFEQRVNALALQPDGKVVVGVRRGKGTQNNLVRLNADGTLDRSFAGPSNEDKIKGVSRIRPVAGGLNYSGTREQGEVNALLIQPDGKILVAGDFDAYNGDENISRGVMRLNRDGTVDKTFNYSASRKGRPVYADQGVLALALQPDGKILIGGVFVRYNEDGDVPHGVMRLNRDGTVDKSFNPGGSGTDAGVAALALQPDGRVLVGGGVRSYNGSEEAPDRVFRLLPNGTLDKTFNYRPGRTAGPNKAVRTLAVRPTGKITVGGSFDAYNDKKVPRGLVELNADGSPVPPTPGAVQPDPDLAIQEDQDKKLQVGFAKMDQEYGIAGVKFETPLADVSNLTLASDSRDTKMYYTDDPLTVGSVRARGLYRFYKGRLAEVRFQVKADQSQQLLEALQKAYGPGVPGDNSVNWDSERVHMNYSFDPAKDPYAKVVLWSNIVSKELGRDMREDGSEFMKNNTPAKK
jgi:uncharacterized delta-60 repeat protein